MDYDGVHWVAQFAMGKLAQTKVIYCAVDKYMGLAFDNILCE